MPVGPSMRGGGGGAKAARRAGRGGRRRAAVVLLLALAYAAGLLMFVLGGGGSVRRHIRLGHHLCRLRLRFMVSQHVNDITLSKFWGALDALCQQEADSIRVAAFKWLSHN